MMGNGKRNRRREGAENARDKRKRRNKSGGKQARYRQKRHVRKAPTVEAWYNKQSLTRATGEGASAGKR